MGRGGSPSPSRRGVRSPPPDSVGQYWYKEDQQNKKNAYLLFLYYFSGKLIEKPTTSIIIKTTPRTTKTITRTTKTTTRGFLSDHIRLYNLPYTSTALRCRGCAPPEPPLRLGEGLPPLPKPLPETLGKNLGKNLVINIANFPYKEDYIVLYDLIKSPWWWFWWSWWWFWWSWGWFFYS